MKVLGSDIAKFGTLEEQNMELRQYAQSSLLPYDKTTEEKIAHHSKELQKKYREDIKIRHRQADNASGISSANSKISKTMSSRKPKKTSNRNDSFTQVICHTKYLFNSSFFSSLFDCKSDELKKKEEPSSSGLLWI